MNKIVLRRATPDDAEKVSSLLHSVVLETDGLTILDNDFPEILSKSGVQHISPRASLIIAEQEKSGSIDGCAMFEPYWGHIHAYDHVATMAIYVRKEFYGKGVGKNLLEDSLKAARDSNFEKIFTYTTLHNERAIRFLCKNGFEIVGTPHKLVKRDGNYIDGVIIEKLL